MAEVGNIRLREGEGRAQRARGGVKAAEKILQLMNPSAPIAPTRSSPLYRADLIDLSPEEWQARHDAACAIVARKYCDLFGFWRDCRYKPCRSARRCSGDQGACLQSRYRSVPYDVGIAARTRMAAQTPPNADRFTRAAHGYEHGSLCLHKATSEKMRAKMQVKMR